MLVLQTKKFFHKSKVNYMQDYKLSVEMYVITKL